MEAVRKDIMRDAQNQTWADPAQWYKSSVCSASVRLRYALRYAKILELLDVLKSGLPADRLKILELGCGVGLSSPLLATLGDITAIDYSREAIKTARGLFGDSKGMKFVEGDALMPNIIPELQERRFDLILAREFHPLTRYVTDISRPYDIVAEYYSRLAPRGVMIIEHALPLFMWKQSDHVLQTQRIVKGFRAMVFNTPSLDIALDILSRFPSFVCGSIKRVYYLSRLLSALVVAYALIRRLHVSKTVVIQRRS